MYLQVQHQCIEHRSTNAFMLPDINADLYAFICSMQIHVGFIPRFMYMCSVHVHVIVLYMNMRA